MKTPIGIFLLLAVALLLVELSFRKEKRTPKTDEQALRLEQIKAEIARLKQELDHSESAQYFQPRHPESAQQTKDLNSSVTISHANDFSMPDDNRSSRFKNFFNNGLKHKHTSNEEDEEIEPFSEWLASAQNPSQARVQGMPQAQTQGASQTQAQVQGSSYPPTGPLNQGSSQYINAGQTNGFGGVTQQQRADQQQYQTTTREIQGY